MKALSSTPNNIVPAGSIYDATGRFILSGIYLDEQYLFIPAGNDTACDVAPGHTLNRKGVFTAPGNSIVLQGKPGAAVTATIGECQPVNLFPATVTPTMPARQVSIGYTNQANPNWSRMLQVSDEYIFTKHGSFSVAMPLHEFINLMMTQEIGLTWTPPIVHQQPASIETEAGKPVTLEFIVASEYDVTYTWEESTDGKTWTTVPDSKAAKLTVTSATTKSYRCTASDDLSEYDPSKTNGSVTSIPATITVKA